MKHELIKSINLAQPRETQTADLHYLAVVGGNWHILIFFKSDKTVFNFWLGIVGKPKIGINPLEVEPMDKDGAVAFGKNRLIERIKEIL